MFNSALTEYIESSGQIPAQTVNNVLDKFVEYLAIALKSQNEVTMRGFGTFSARLVPPTVRKNPRTGEPVEVPERVKPKLKFSGSFIKTLQTGSIAAPPAPTPTAPVSPAPNRNVPAPGTAPATTPAPTETVPKKRGRKSKAELAAMAASAGATGAGEAIATTLIPAPMPAPAPLAVPPSSVPPVAPPPPPPELVATDKLWWVYNNQDKGSVPISQSGLIGAGVAPDTLLWCEGTDWRPAKNIPELGYLFPIAA